jgi:broad specificity phosphatase PhoE
MTAPGPIVTLLRHGETEWSKSGQHTGRTDVPLTETGERQAKEAGAALQGARFDRVLVSPMHRARCTAELAGLGDYEVDDDLREWDYGDFEGKTTAEIQAVYPGWSIWEGPWQGGETADQIKARVDRVAAKLLEAPPGSRVAVVAHGHLLRVLGARWVGAPVSAGKWLALDTAARCRLAWEHDYRVVHRWNLVGGATIQA